MVVPISVCADHRCSEGAVGRSRAVIAAFAARALLVSSVASSFIVTPAEAGGKVGRAESTVSIALDPKSDTGSAGDGVTRDATPTVFGSAPPKSKVVVTDGGRVVAAVTARANGSWRRTVARLAEGTHGLVATVIGAGASATLAVVVDVNKPAPPTIALAPPFAAAADRSLVTAATRPTFTGTAEPGATVTIKEGSRVAGTTIAAGNGMWTLMTAALSPRTYRFSASATDRAGNVSGSSGSLAVTVTGVAAAAPTLVLAPSSDTGLSAVDRITRDATPTASGTATPKVRVEILDGTRTLAMATASSAGTWQRTLPTLADGRHFLAARAGETSPVVEIVVDTTKPATPTIALVGGAHAGTPMLAGTTSPEAVVTIREGAIVRGTATANGAGQWSLTTPSLAAGTHRFAARASDLAGNESGSSASLGVDIEPEVARPVTVDLTAASDTSRSDDDITRDRTPTLTGTATPGAMVTVKDFNTVVGSATASDAGDWSFTAIGLSAGEHRFLASAAGRSSAPLIVVVETVPAVVDLTTPRTGSASRFDGLVAVREAESEHPHAGVGDVNGDGLPDFIVGEPEADRDVHLVFGRGDRFPAVVDLSSLGDAGSRLVLSDRGDNWSELGGSQQGIGDVNGDGLNDIALLQPANGRVFVVLGRRDFPEEIDLSVLNGSNGGFVLEGPELQGAGVQTVAAAGDFNADGIGDFVIGNPDVPAAGGRASMATIVFGRPTFQNTNYGSPDTPGQLIFFGPSAEQLSTHFVSGGGDVNGDGVDDVVVGSPSVVSPTGFWSGAIHVLYGRAGVTQGTEYAATLSATAGDAITLPGVEAIGLSAQLAGDLDGDGLDDIIAAGLLRAVVIYGRTGGFGEGGPAAQWLELLPYDSDVRNVSGAGDLDGDGLADILVHVAGWYSDPEWDWAPAVAVVYGRDLRSTGTLDLRNAVGGEAGFLIRNALGHVAGAGDVDGDGRGDALMACRSPGSPAAACLVYGP